MAKRGLRKRGRRASKADGCWTDLVSNYASDIYLNFPSALGDW